MRRFYPFLLLLAVGCQPAGCTRPAPPAALAATDDLGRSVSLPRPAERIVSLSPAATEILFAIGAGPKVVAGTEFDTYPAEAKALPRVGGFTPQSINLEAVLAHQPDLVVAAPQSETIAALERLGVPVLALDPKSLADVAADIELLGRMTGHEGEAKALAAKFAAAGSPPATASRPRVLFVLDADAMISCGRGTFIDELITLAGGENVLAGESGYPKVNDEYVLRQEVDVIVCVDHATGADDGVPARLKKRTGWDRLAAVKTGRVVAVNADLVARPGPRLLDGLAAVRNALRE